MHKNWTALGLQLQAGGGEVRGSSPKAMGIINVYCSFMSLSLSACFHPLGIVCVREHYSLFDVCLTYAPTRAHTVEFGGIKGSLAHTTLMESRC